MNLTIDETYIESYSNRLRINFYIDICASLFAIYIILRHTPKHMGQYKIFLLDIAICSMLLDIHATLFYIPIPLFPLTGFCTGGLLKNFGYIWGSVIPYDIYMAFVALCGASMNCAFVYRYTAVTSKVEIFDKTKTWVYVAAFHVILALPALITHVIAAETEGTEDLILVYIEKKYPEYLNLFKTHTCSALMFGTEYPWTIVYIIIMVVNILFSAVFTNILIVLTLKHLKSVEKFITKSTYKAQRQLVFSLLLQTIVPTLSLGVPYVGLIIMVVMQVDNMQHLNWLGFEVASLHSLFNTLLMCLMTPNYRQVVIRPYYVLKRKLTKSPIEEHDMTKRSKAGSTIQIVAKNTRRVSDISHRIPIARY